MKVFSAGVPKLFLLIAAFAVFSGCSKKIPEMTAKKFSAAAVIPLYCSQNKQTLARWRHGVRSGKIGATGANAIISDPKSFNQLIAERDNSTASIVSMMTTSLVDYDFVLRQWKAKAASFEIITDETAQTLDVKYTLRGDLLSLLIRIRKTRNFRRYCFWYEVKSEAIFAGFCILIHNC
ncbi:hypothetical protein [Treponema parvum]|uniref:hypothetical protein n=1 Tax=Treponema parvum TaxID=138851 RepID=UPI001AEC2FC5|nr:hypothetical protein [Treponema parvum]QTQ16578.1 hypothetical protein HXT04_07685 [Treponema parvum]